MTYDLSSTKEPEKAALARDRFGAHIPTDRSWPFSAHQIQDGKLIIFPEGRKTTFSLTSLPSPNTDYPINTP
ncbi:hypothetical protein GHK24_00135 [Rhodocyclus tenuis]|uniref:Uncharacterized protein n=2 Tax=Rhodocyclus TaxID=1064 RepID=A0A6L5JTN4_RHOTE|nr:hypothetical protein [Rhodocyclus gracilis]